MIVALVPAAGRSRRMGRPKLLLPVDGKPMVTRVVDALLEAGVGQLRVVVPPAARELREALAGRPVRFIVNPQPESAMLDSIRCGLAELPPGCRGVLVTPADIPGITPPLLRRLIRAFESAPAEKSLFVPVARGRRGHPLIFSAVHVPEVLAGLDDTG
ncbi:MAG: nucleotidyltransferase family protein, partial [Verrucomicrobia bacterium]